MPFLLPFLRAIFLFLFMLHKRNILINSKRMLYVEIFRERNEREELRGWNVEYKSWQIKPWNQPEKENMWTNKIQRYLKFLGLLARNPDSFIFFSGRILCFCLLVCCINATYSYQKNVSGRDILRDNRKRRTWGVFWDVFLFMRVLHKRNTLNKYNRMFQVYIIFWERNGWAELGAYFET